MNIIKQSHEIINFHDDALQQIEKAGRTCYQSQDKITEDSAEKFVAMLGTKKIPVMWHKDYDAIQTWTKTHAGPI